MSKIYKRPDSDIYYFSGRYHGKKIRKSTGYSMKKHAEIIKRKWEGLLANDDLSFLNNAHLPYSNIDMFIKEYLKIRERKSENTNATSKGVTNKFKQYLTSVNISDLQDINTKVMDGYVEYMNCAPKTKKNHIIELRQMFKIAINWGILSFNPAINVTLPNIIKKDLHRPFEPAELAIIFKESGKYYIYFNYLYQTGLRAGDVSCLKYSNIDREKHIITAFIHKAGSFHKLAITDHLISITEDRNDDVPIFPSLYAESVKKRGDKFSVARKYLQRILKRHNLKHATLHSFRTTFNNTLRDLGLSIDDRAALMAHSSSETTKIYTQPNIEKALEYVNKLPTF